MKNAALHTITSCAVLIIICCCSLPAHTTFMAPSFLSDAFTELPNDTPPEDSVTISGTVLSWCDEPVAGFPVMINGHIVYTDINGMYNLEVPTGTDFTITYGPMDDYANGVDSTDLLALPQFVLFGFPSPYAAIAADMNMDQLTSTYDLVLLSQFIEGITASFPGPSWILIPADYVFPNPNDPWMEAYPEVININNLNTDWTADFVAVKRGDVDCSANPVLTDPGPAIVSGFVFDELSGGACDYSSEDLGLANWIIEAVSGTETFYASTASDGSYQLELPEGNYDIKAILPNDLREACNIALPITVEDGDNINLDLGHYQQMLCPDMEFDFAPVELTACSSTTYYFRYANNGTLLAENGSLEVSFEDGFTILDSELSWSDQGGGVYQFALEDVAPGEFKTFTATVEVDCTIEQGRSYCVDAKISPGNLCAPTHSNWDGSKLELSASCIGDSVRFTIHNLGAAMEQSRAFIVIEDDLVMMQESIYLGADAYHTFTRAANGTTQRLELESQQGPYGANTPNIAIEACGVNANGVQSLGFITAYNNDSGYPFERRICIENTPTDGNNKKAIPKGIGADAYLASNTPITYQIYFQNTSDSVVNYLLIKDQLPLGVNPGSVKPGASSHPYTFSLSGNGELTFFMENMMLPSTGGIESKGFVSFSIEQELNNPAGMMLENTASVSFDFGPSTSTNYASHLIDDDFFYEAGPTVYGSIESEDGNPVAATIYMISQGDTIAQTYGSSYSFPTYEGLDFRIVPYRTTNNFNGISVFDIVLLARHIQGVQTLNSPYKIIAADVNNSGSLTILDIITIRKRILAYIEQWPELPDYRFVHWGYIFPDPYNPWLETFPEEGTNLYQNDFVAVKLGDLNLDGTLLQNGQPEARHTLMLSQKHFPEEKEIMFFPELSHSLAGYQIALSLPPGVQIEAVKPLIDAGFFDFNQHGNELRILWYNTVPVNFDEHNPLFVIKGNKLDGITPYNESFGQAVGAHQDALNIVVMPNDVRHQAIAVFPNPVHKTLNIKGQAANNALEIQLFNHLGQGVYQQRLEVSGAWKHQINVDHLKAGIYQLSVQQGADQYVEKVHVWH